MKKLTLVAVWVLLAVFARSAEAHKINVFAYAEGQTIHGEAYARGGEAIRDAKIEVFDPADSMKKLGETVTDDDGNFTFEARHRSDHRFVLSTADGHEAEFTVKADELPPTLPASGGAPAPQAETPPTEPLPAEPTPEVESTDNADSVQAEVDSLTRQIVQLRREMQEFQQKLRFSDILGAIGYIVGVMGLSFYFLGVKKKREGTGS